MAEYTPEQQAAYWKKKYNESKTVRGPKQANGKKGKKKRVDKDGNPLKLSGCQLVKDYKDKNGKHTGRPMIWGWRISKRFGFQHFSAYLDKNDGASRNGTSTDVCLMFVVNLYTEGLGKQTLSGVYSKQHEKLSMTDAQLVANPNANNGGYFGRGGERYKKQATSGK